MKKTVVLFFLLLIFKVSSYTQVLDLTNVKREIIPNKYDGSFCFIPPNLEQEDYAGLVGEKIIILDSMFYNHNDISYKYYGEPFIILEYLVGDGFNQGSFKLGFKSEGFYVSVDEITSETYLKNGFDQIKDSFIGKKLFFTQNPIQGFDGKRYNFDFLKEKYFLVEDVKIAKVEYLGQHKHVPVLLFENGLILSLIEDNYEGNEYRFRDYDGNSFRYFLDAKERINGNDGGAGLGDYDDSGDGIFGRQVIYRNLSGIFDAKITSGKTEIKICIDRSGKVTSAYIISSDEKDSSKKKKIIKGAYGYKYQPDPRAPKEQCGKLTIVADIRAIRGN